MANPHYTLPQQSGEFSSLPDTLESTANMSSSSALLSGQQSQQESPAHHAFGGHNHGQHQHARSLSQPHSSFPLQQSGGPPIDNLQYAAHQDQTTMVLGVLGYLDRLEREITEMRDFVNLGFKKLNDVGNMDGGIGVRIESVRLQARNWNRSNVTELEESFRLLPRSNGELPPNDVPTTGALLREINHKMIDYLLDIYDIPFVPTMFLTEKKMLYLKFLGANRIVMHRILD